MDDSCAAMVEDHLVDVRNGQGIYPESAVWAEPDMVQASAQMRRLAADPALRRDLGRKGQRRIAGQPTPAQFGEGYAVLIRTPGESSEDHPSPSSTGSTSHDRVRHGGGGGPADRLA